MLRFHGNEEEADGLNMLQDGGDRGSGGASTRFLTPVRASSSKIQTTPTSRSPSSTVTTTSEAGPSYHLASTGSSSSSSSTALSHLAFHGNLSLSVPPQHAGRVRTGWASFRTRNRELLWGEECWDLNSHTHLRLVVGYRGWEGWRNRWYCNIQTDGPILYVPHSNLQIQI
jgi:NADH dehydrogenase [ubiquinone] 1 alpha subcomplex assembly factor 1